MTSIVKKRTLEHRAMHLWKHCRIDQASLSDFSRKPKGKGGKRKGKEGRQVGFISYDTCPWEASRGLCSAVFRNRLLPLAGATQEGEHDKLHFLKDLHVQMTLLLTFFWRKQVTRPCTSSKESGPSPSPGSWRENEMTGEAPNDQKVVSVAGKVCQARQFNKESRPHQTFETAMSRLHRIGKFFKNVVSVSLELFNFFLYGKTQKGQ